MGQLKQSLEKCIALSAEKSGVAQPGRSRHCSAFGGRCRTNHRAKRQTRIDEPARPGHHLIGVVGAGDILSSGCLIGGKRELRKTRACRLWHRGCVSRFVLPNLEMLELCAADGGGDSEYLGS